jgi:hypothetical protein
MSIVAVSSTYTGEEVVEEQHGPYHPGEPLEQWAQSVILPVSHEELRNGLCKTAWSPSPVYWSHSYNLWIYLLSSFLPTGTCLHRPVSLPTGWEGQDKEVKCTFCKFQWKVFAEGSRN